MGILAGLYKRQPEQMAAHINAGKPLIFYSVRKVPLKVGDHFTHKPTGIRFVVIRLTDIHEYLNNLPPHTSKDRVMGRIAAFEAALEHELQYMEVMSD